MKRLNVLENYISNRGRFGAGQVISVDDSFGEWLMNDCPSCFEEYVEPKPEPVEKEVEEPPVDKMVKAPAVKKSAAKPRKASSG